MPTKNSKINPYDIKALSHYVWSQLNWAHGTNKKHLDNEIKELLDYTFPSDKYPNLPKLSEIIKQLETETYIYTCHLYEIPWAFVRNTSSKKHESKEDFLKRARATEERYAKIDRDILIRKLIKESFLSIEPIKSLQAEVDSAATNLKEAKKKLAQAKHLERVRSRKEMMEFLKNKDALEL